MSKSKVRKVNRNISIQDILEFIEFKSTTVIVENIQVHLQYLSVLPQTNLSSNHDPSCQGAMLNRRLNSHFYGRKL